MRMHGGKVRRFQMGGVNAPASLGALQPGAASPQMAQLAAQQQGVQPSPQQMQAIQAMRQRMAQPQGNAPVGVPGGAGGAAPGAAGGPNPLSQQLAARGAMPTPAPTAGPASTLGAAPPGGMMPPGAGGQPGMAGPAGAGNFQPRPGMGGIPGGAPQGLMGGAPPGGGQSLQAALQQNPQAAQAALAGMGMAGMKKGGRVRGFGGDKIVEQQGMKGTGDKGMKGTAGGKIKRTPANTFDSTKPAPGNLATSQAGKKMAEGGRVNSFDSLKSVGGNLPLQKQSEPLKKAKGGRAVLHKKPRAAERQLSYDKSRAGDDGWPPTPNFTGEPGPNAPSPVPAATAISPTPAGPPGMAEGGKWIDKAIKHPGALRAQLHTPKGEKIPQATLAKAARKPGVLGERARMAETMRGFKKAKGGACVEDKDRDRMRKGGECDKMAAGGVAKLRRGFPNTIKPSKRMATGGTVRGAGAAERGKNFSGIY